MPFFDGTVRKAQELEGEALAGMGRTDDAVRVWSALIEVSDIPTRERVAGEMATLLKKSQRLLDGSNALVLQAHADRDVPDATQAKALDRAALLALGGGDPGAAIAHWTVAIELAEGLHAHRLACRIRPRLAAALREVCRDDEARLVVDVVWSDRTASVGLRVDCALMAGDIALSNRQLGKAEEWYDQAAGLLKAKHGAGMQVRVERRRAELDALRQHPRALERVTAAARAAHRARATRDLSRLHAIRGYLLACAERADEVGPSSVCPSHSA